MPIWLAAARAWLLMARLRCWIAVERCWNAIAEATEATRARAVTAAIALRCRIADLN